jgi:ABC-type transport system involved in multi-copper enzyme maturation permease subunit
VNKLLKTDFKRILSDKLFKILCIIGGAFAVFTPLLYKILFSAVDAEEMLSMTINAKSLFFTAFSPGDNFGLVLPILLVIIICKDFNHGTVRNKLICGYSRKSVFLSMYIACATVICTLILCYALINLFVALIFLEYQATAFTMADFGYLMLSVLFEIIIYLFISALVCFYISFAKNVGLSIVFYVGTMFLLLIVGVVAQVAFMFTDPANTVLYKFMEFLTISNPFMPTAIGAGTEYKLYQALSIALPSFIGAVLFVFLGALIFSKKDLK